MTATIEHRVQFSTVVTFDPPIETTSHMIGRTWTMNGPFIVRRALIEGPWDGRRGGWSGLTVYGARVKKDGTPYDENSDSHIYSERQEEVVAFLGLGDAVEAHRKIQTATFKAARVPS